MSIGVGTLGALETALSGLEAQQSELQTTAQNVSNANTPGYSRQTANLTENVPLTIPPITGGIPTGVVISGYQRSRDTFLDNYYRGETADVGNYQQQSTSLSQIETLFNEPGTDGLGSMISNYFSNWQAVANNPSDLASRQALVQSAQTLADGLQQTRSFLTNTIGDLTTQETSAVGEVNSLAGQIASLNSAIGSSVLNGQASNDLLDQRDELLDQISTYGDIQTTVNPTNQEVTVTMAGVNIVDPTVAGGTNALAVTDVTAGLPASGQLRGLYDLINTTIPGYVGQLDTLAGSLINNTNTQQGLGTDLNGNPGSANAFFNGTDASNIAVNPAVLADPTLVAASLSGATGDGSNALAQYDLQDTTTTGGSTYQGYLQSVITGLGITSQGASSKLNVAQSLQTAIDNNRQQVSGVNIDEEMSNMIRYQNAYAASAKVMSTLDTMLNSLVGMVQ